MCIIAGPAIGRGRAEHGATVLHNTCDSLRDFHVLHPDLSQGKFNAFLDLKTEAGEARFRELLADTDVAIDGCRPGCLERLGLGRDALNLLVDDRAGRGIIYGRENACGWHGP
ncbi:hypothetical protein EW146_g1593 [Bondarzewia mesenterica]|uniref:Uncharacterized protein n=1 Tax=Bondarzewia mesenterica TaxID=1095465 RepID=A0A4S4M3B9_9AGAM|nr:hypothetical protein EW146_g1593 [Bondarzewia mesenterica]